MQLMRHIIKSASLKGGKFETADPKSAESKLREVRKKDPGARLLSIPAAR